MLTKPAHRQVRGLAFLQQRQRGLAITTESLANHALPGFDNGPACFRQLSPFLLLLSAERQFMRLQTCASKACGGTFASGGVGESIDAGIRTGSHFPATVADYRWLCSVRRRCGVMRP